MLWTKRKEELSKDSKICPSRANGTTTSTVMALFHSVRSVHFTNAGLKSTTRTCTRLVPTKKKSGTSVLTRLNVIDSGTLNKQKYKTRDEKTWFCICESKRAAQLQGNLNLRPIQGGISSKVTKRKTTFLPQLP